MKRQPGHGNKNDAKCVPRFYKGESNTFIFYTAMPNTAEQGTRREILGGLQSCAK